MKKKIYVLIGLITMIFSGIGLTFAYFAVGSSVANKTNVNANIDGIGTVSLSGGATITKIITAADMAESNASLTYNLEEANIATATLVGEDSTASYFCEFTLNVTNESNMTTNGSTDGGINISVADNVTITGANGEEFTKGELLSPNEIKAGEYKVYFQMGEGELSLPNQTNIISISGSINNDEQDGTQADRIAGKKIDLAYDVEGFSCDLDTTAPEVNDFYIESKNQTYLTKKESKVYLSWLDEDVKYYCITEDSNTDNCTWIEATGKSAEIEYTFASDGEKTLYAYIKDRGGKVSTVANRTIIVDTEMPTNNSVTINDGVEYTKDTNIKLTLTSTGASEMCISNTETCDKWVAYAPTKSHTLTSGSGEKTVYVWFRDAAGNVTEYVTNTIIYDNAAPTNNSVIINNNSASTNNKEVKLTLSSDGANEMCISNTEECNTWEVYATSKSHILTDGDGEKTIYVWFRDAAGNVTENYVSQTIELDTLAPTGNSVVINSGITYATSESVTLTLTTDGAKEVCISNTSTCDSWEEYEQNKSHTLSTGDGEKIVYVWFKDAAGNATANYVSDTIILDTEAPKENSIVINNGEKHTNNENVKLTLSSNGATKMCISNTENCSEWIDYKENINYTLPSGDGEKVIYVLYKDDAGNKTNVVSATIELDKEAPKENSVTINNGSSITNNKEVTLTLVSNGANEMCVSNTEICNNWISYSQNKSHTLSTGDGEKTVYVWFRDKAGNTANSITDTIILDTLAPTENTIIINNGAAYSQKETVTLTLSSNGANEMCISNTINCDNWEAYASSKNWTLTNGDGEKIVYVWYKDAAGNVTSSYVSDKIVLDTAAPTENTIIINNGAAYSTTKSVTLTLRSSGTQEMCVSNTNDCTSWEPYTTSKSWTLSGNDGTKTVYVWYKDAAGNITDYVTDTIELDTVAPTNNKLIINSGETHTKETNITLTLGSSGANEMCISNTNNCDSWEPYASSKNWTIETGDGEKTVYVWYRDAAGNISNSVSDAIILDTLAPTGNSVQIDKGAISVNNINVTLTLESTGATEMCVSNTSNCTNWENFTTSKSWTITDGDGTKTIYVWYKDKAGNISDYVTDRIILDTVAPAGNSVTINSGATYTTSTNVTLTLASEGATEMCISNTSTCTNWEDYLASKSHTLQSGDGEKTIYVWYRDLAGNETNYVSDKITLDTAAPTGNSVAINSGEAYTNTSSVTLTLGSSGASEMCVSNTNSCSNWENYTTSKNWSLGTSDGEKTVYVWYRDLAGNVTSTYVSDTIILDTEAPTNSSVTINNGATYTTSTTVTLTLSSTGASEMCISNTNSCSSWETYSTSKTHTLTSGEGTKTVYVWYKDAAGNATPSYVTNTINYDSSNPTLTVTAPTGTSSSSPTYVRASSYTVSGTATDSYGIESVTINGTKVTLDANGAFSKNLTLTEGSVTTVKVIATDKAGKTATVTRYVSYDVSAPTNSSIRINNNATYATSTSVTLNLSSTGAKEVCISNTTSCSNWVTYASSKSWTLTSGDGTKTVYAWFRDGAGNTTSSYVSDSIILDTSLPTVTASAVSNLTTSPKISIKSNEAGTYCVNTSSSRTYMSGCIASGSISANSAIETSALTTSNTYYVHVKDAAGNVGISSAISITKTVAFQTQLTNNRPKGLSTTMEAGLYRFQGTNDAVNNHICFGTSDKSTCTSDTDRYMYRIIGIDSSGQIKVIKKEALHTEMKWYNDVTANILWPNSNISKNINGSTFYTNTTYVPTSWQSKIVTYAWKYSDLEDKNQSAPLVYEAEMKYTDTVNAKIGLMYVHDYYYAYQSGGLNCGTTWGGATEYLLCGQSWLHLRNNDTNPPTGSDGYSLDMEWTMTRNRYMCYQDSGCDLTVYTIYNPQYYMSGQHSFNPAQTRPVFFLASSVNYVSGTGTSSDPFIIS